MPPQENNVPPVNNPIPVIEIAKPKRNYAFLLTLTFLLILTGIFGVWFFSNSAPDEGTDTFVITNKFADWKTYTNTEYGFEMKYPTNMNINESITGNILGVAFKPDGEVLWERRGNDFIITIFPDENIYINLNDFHKKYPKTLNEYLNFYTQIYDAYGIEYKVIKFLNSQAYIIQTGGMGSGFNLLFENSGHIYVIALPREATGESPNFGLSAVNGRILSTFKFFEPQTVESSPISLTEYGQGSFLTPEYIQQGTEVVLKWTDDTWIDSWGNMAYICLIGLDENNQTIELTATELTKNKNICYPDMQFLLGTTTVSSKEYKWFASNSGDKFIKPPKSFKLSVRILDSRPPEGLSEWAGQLSESTSNEFKIK